MARKTGTVKRRISRALGATLVDKQIDNIGYHIVEEEYAKAVALSERLLKSLSPHAPRRVDALVQLGISQSMLQNYPECYAAYTEALTLSPDTPSLWFNRGMASRYTSRMGKSLRDFERAKELSTNSEWAHANGLTINPAVAKMLEKELKRARKLANHALKQRGPDFTLEQLIVQEDLFQEGLRMAEAGEWEKAEQTFREVIAMGDGLPQPWGNLGIALLMQTRYDEAEAAFKQALVIDSHYSLARTNLAVLPETRRTGPPAILDVRDPFRDNPIRKSVTFANE